MRIKEFLIELFTEKDSTPINPRMKKIGTYFLKYFLCCSITTILMMATIEVVYHNNIEWPRVHKWHECLHTHGHFNWKLYWK